MSSFVSGPEKKSSTRLDSPTTAPGEHTHHIDGNLIDSFVSSTTSSPKDVAKKFLEFSGCYHLPQSMTPSYKQNISSLKPSRLGSVLLDQIQGSNIFRSKNASVNDSDINQKSKSPSKKQSRPGISPQSSPLKLVQELIVKNHISVPSIPSNIHRFGYKNTENGLKRNKNPHEKAEEEIGPGYYEVKDTIQSDKYKAPSWDKMSPKKTDIKTIGASNDPHLGPGRYQAPEEINPSYKNNLNYGFASRSPRSFDSAINKKPGLWRLKDRFPTSIKNGIVERKVTRGAESEDEDDDEEYIKEATPGPGYYYKESLVSSFGVRNTPFDSAQDEWDVSQTYTKPGVHGFGATPRFKSEKDKSKNLGPGDYVVESTLLKPGPKAKVPFQSSDVRIKEFNPPPYPGPGTYDLPKDIIDRVVEKTKKGYVGSFGVTEDRFKDPKLEVPGPGAYTYNDGKSPTKDILEEMKGGAHYFVSKYRRAPFEVKPEYNAEPGLYDVDHFDIRTKLAKDYDKGSLKQYPFNAAEERFEYSKERNKIKEEEEEEDNKYQFMTIKDLDSLISPKKKENPTAVFKSKTMRSGLEVQQSSVLGPGIYDASPNPWKKKSFNVYSKGD